LTNSTTKQKPSAKQAWRSRQWHRVALPSGEEVELRIPALAELVKDEAVPENLRAKVLRAAAHPGGLLGVLREEVGEIDERVKAGGATPEERDEALADSIQTLAEIQKRLVLRNVRMLDGETLTEDDLVEGEGIPEPDKELLGLLVLRQAGYDARGRRLGIEPLDAWESFRSHHKCPTPCPACEAFQRELSTSDVGAV
jgi:hypothetical protein